MNRIAQSIIVAGLLVAAAGRAAAQQEDQWLEPQCELEGTGHFLVEQTVVYLKSVQEEEDDTKVARQLDDALRSLTDALARDQEENPAVWYYLGRYYRHPRIRDPFGADSAFARAQELAPACAADIAYYRQSWWVGEINAGIDSLRAGAFESAKVQFRRAGALWDQDNVGFYYMARIFGNEGDADSALAYFRKVVSIPVTDSSRQLNYDESVINIAQLYGMLAAGRGEPALWDSTIAWYQRYRVEVADDPHVIVSIADALEGQGNEEAALAMYDSALLRAQEMEVTDVFKVGEAMFLAERFEIAAEAFATGLQRNPYSQIGLYNLTNSYLAIANDEREPAAAQREAAGKMVDVARRLLEVDPQNRGSLGLLGAAFQLIGRADSARVLQRRSDRLTFEVNVDDARALSGGYEIRGRLINLQPGETQVPGLVFEFLDAAGGVVASDTVTAILLQGGASTDFRLTPQGDGIVAWRYRVEDVG